tara:strand:- start:111 stop:224 length:114 start_codon:yes stop_codon:yes gene_type:complete
MNTCLGYAPSIDIAHKEKVWLNLPLFLVGEPIVFLLR